MAPNEPTAASPIMTQAHIDEFLASDVVRQARIRFLQRLLAQSGGIGREAERAELAELLAQGFHADS